MHIALDVRRSWLVLDKIMSIPATVAFEIFGGEKSPSKLLGFVQVEKHVGYCSDLKNKI